MATAFLVEIRKVNHIESENKKFTGTLQEMVHKFGERVALLTCKGFTNWMTDSGNSDLGLLLCSFANRIGERDRKHYQIEYVLGWEREEPVAVVADPNADVPMMSRVIQMSSDGTNHDNPGIRKEIHLFGVDHEAFSNQALADRVLELSDAGFKMKKAPKNPRYFEGKHKDGRSITIYATTHNTNIPDGIPTVSSFSDTNQTPEPPALTPAQQRIAEAIPVGMANAEVNAARKQGYVDRANALKPLGCDRIYLDELDRLEQLENPSVMDAELLSRKSQDQQSDASLVGTAGIKDGIYTVVRGSGHRTLRFVTMKEGDLKGKTFIKFLRGSDNERDYEGCAFYDPATGKVNLWKRYRNQDFEQDIRSCVAVIAGDPASAGEAYALKSSRCYRCNRTLTVPASVHRGLGPECFAKS